MTKPTLSEKWAMFKIKALLWFLINFRNKTLYRFELGGFKVKFTMWQMKIKSLSDNFKLAILANDHPYAYLLKSAEMGKTENIHGFCVYMYKMCMCLTTEQGLPNEIGKCLTKYDKRMQIKADELAKVYDKNEEKRDLEWVKTTVERSEMSRAERRQAERTRQKDMKKAHKDMIHDDALREIEERANETETKTK